MTLTLQDARAPALLSDPGRLARPVKEVPG
jgi:hypothetical protein